MEGDVAIIISKETVERLRGFGIMGSSYDSVITELMDHADVCDSWWNRK